jgi:carbon monoxide dehydrogenase subunit G
MQMSGEVALPASRERVWDALNDPEVLRQCIPGCESVDRTSPTEFTAKVVAKVGPVKASFTGKVALTDIDPPNGYKISGEGSGGVAGFAKGGADVRLSDDPIGTMLKYSVDAQIGGKLAQIGSRLIDSTAKSYAKDFFERFAAVVSSPAAGSPEMTTADVIASGEVPVPPPGIGPSPEPDEDAAMDAAAQIAVNESRTLPPWIWIGGVILLIAVVLGLVVLG